MERNDFALMISLVFSIYIPSTDIVETSLPI